MISIEALLTCHNRCDLTLAALTALFAQRLSPEVRLHATLCDDGSHDGTAASVLARFPDRVRVVAGDGNLFWNRGMLHAWRATEAETPDHVLWLNDDVILDPEALVRLLAVAGPRTVAGGATRDPEDGTPTYGGFRRGRRLRLLPVPPGPATQELDTCNGNCVLVPRPVAELVGRLDPVFHHGLGDLDYGLRCIARGIALRLVPGTVGSCRRNASAGTWRDATLPLLDRWRRILAPTGLPPREWLRFCWRHAGAAGIAVWAWTYARIWLGLPGPRR